ncbi:hypothetical protein [Adhaeribacter arboris]|uniref:hypothetical protein n=1 Tax=Adhaeribacter arboris TaxID=2072846 RepID=UPI001304F45B|nr:hypothetical protein [Adhaeribacter arboris]
MKKKALLLVFCVCAFFVLMGLGTILKGDIENRKEALIMATYLLFFLSIMLLITRPKFG